MKDEGIGLMRAMALIGVVASLASAVEPVSSRDNLIRNGNFEQHSAKHIPGWQAVQHNDRYDIDIDTKVRHGGAAGLRLTWKGGADARTNFNIAQFSVDPRQQYRLSLWVKRTHPDQYFDVWLQLREAGSDQRKHYLKGMIGARWLRPTADAPADPRGWRQYVCENMIFCEDDVLFMLYFGKKKATAEPVTVWVDDVTLTPMSDPTFPITDVSAIQLDAPHPVLFDAAAARARHAADAKALMPAPPHPGDGPDDRLQPLGEIRSYGDRFVDGKWTTLGKLGESNIYDNVNYGLRTAARTHALTMGGPQYDAKYLRAVRKDLLAWTDAVGADFDSQEIGWYLTKGGRLTEQKFVLWLAQVYDDIYEQLGPADRARIENDLLRPALANMDLKFGGNNNRYVRGTCVAAMVGMVLKDRELLRKPFHRIGGHDYMLRHAVGADGSMLGDASSTYVDYTFGMLGKLLYRAHHAGLNLYESPKMAKLMTFLPRVIFPDGRNPAYGDAAWESYRHGWGPYEIYRRLVPNPIEFDYKSEAFDDGGYAVLRQGEGADHISVGFTYGAQGGHGHPDQLGIILYGHEQVLAPDAAHYSYDGDDYFPFIAKAVSHNKVVVDETGYTQQRRQKHLQFFAEAPRIQTVSAWVADYDPGVRQHRTLVLTADYVLDLYRCTSDEVHRYDWIHHNFGAKLSSDAATAPWRGPVGITGGYTFLEGRTTGRTRDHWSATWELDGGKGVSLRMAGGPLTEVITAHGPGRRKDHSAPPVPAIVARRRARDTAYVATLEPYRAEPRIERVVELRAKWGVGAAVIRTAGCDVFGWSYDGNAARFKNAAGKTLLTVDGDLGAASREQSRLQYLFMVNAAKLITGSVRLSATPKTTVYAEVSKTGESMRIENRGRHKSTVTATIAGSRQSRALSPGESFDMPAPRLVTPPIPSTAVWPSNASRPPMSPAPDAIAAGKNLLTNPDLADSAAGWLPFDSYPGIWFWDNPVGHAEQGRGALGSLEARYVKVYIHGSQPAGWAQMDIVDPRAGTYEAAAWVKASKPTKVRLGLYAHEPGWGRALNGAISDRVTVGTSWQRITHRVALDHGLSGLRLVLLRCAQGGNTERGWEPAGGDVWFDDISVALTHAK